MTPPCRPVAPVIALLRQRRESLGISQEDMEERIGVTRGLVQKWETGVRQPSAFLLTCYAEALGGSLVLAAPASPASAPAPATVAASHRAPSAIATRNF